MGNLLHRRKGGTGWLIYPPRSYSDRSGMQVVTAKAFSLLSPFSSHARLRDVGTLEVIILSVFFLFCFFCGNKILVRAWVYPGEGPGTGRIASKGTFGSPGEGRADVAPLPCPCKPLFFASNHASRGKIARRPLTKSTRTTPDPGQGRPFRGPGRRRGLARCSVAYGEYWSNIAVI